MAAELLKKKFMGKWVEVELIDGRLIQGQLAGTDREPNFILIKAEERWDRNEKDARHIGMAMVARRNAKKIMLIKRVEKEAKKPAEEEAEPMM